MYSFTCWSIQLFSSQRVSQFTRPQTVLISPHSFQHYILSTFISVSFDIWTTESSYFNLHFLVWLKQNIFICLWVTYISFCLNCLLLSRSPIASDGGCGPHAPAPSIFRASWFGSRVADRVLVLQPGVRPEPLRWESRDQNTGPPETSQSHIIPISESSPRDLHFNDKTQLHPPASKLQCWTLHAKQLARQEHNPTH